MEAAATIRVVIADDQRLLRQCFTHVLSADAEIEVVGTCADGHTAFLLAIEQEPDLVLMDLEMPVMDGIEASALIRERVPGAQILMLSGHEEAFQINRAVAGGVTGYILKDAPLDELVRIVKAVHRGEPISSPYLKDNWLRLVQDSLLASFTERERDLLELLSQGLSNRDIADRLFLSEQTVKRNMKSVLEKLGVKNRTQAAMKILQLGLVESRQQS